MRTRPCVGRWSTLARTDNLIVDFEERRAQRDTMVEDPLEKWKREAEAARPREATDSVIARTIAEVRAELQEHASFSAAC